MGLQCDEAQCDRYRLAKRLAKRPSLLLACDKCRCSSFGRDEGESTAGRSGIENPSAAIRWGGMVLYVQQVRA